MAGSCYSPVAGSTVVRGDRSDPLVEFTVNVVLIYGPMLVVKTCHQTSRKEEQMMEMPSSDVVKANQT